MARDCTKPRPYSAVVKTGLIGEERSEEEIDSGVGARPQEPLPAAGNQANEDKVESVEEGMVRREEKGERSLEQDGEKVQQGEDPQKCWEVVGKPRRKSAKRRRKVSPAASSEDGKLRDQDVREEVLEEGGNVEGYVLRGTQTECMHTPLSDVTSDGDMEEEGESEEKSEDSFIKDLLLHVNMDS